MPIIAKNGLIQDVQNTIEILPNTINPEEAFKEFGTSNILGIEFAAHSDGRGFTLAKRLRNLGFKGVLRAVGPLIPDQFADAIACGFDEIEISEEQLLRQPITDWEASLKAYSVAYQNNNGEKISILEARKKARLNA